MEARALLAGDAKVRYLDVRTVAEFDRGRPPGACNVPLLVQDTSTGMMTPNPDFLKVVQASFAKDEPIIVGCASGARSSKAAKMLADAGFTACHNMLGGFSGAHDPAGEVVEVGWQGLGFTTTNDAGDGSSYASLRDAAG